MITRFKKEVDSDGNITIIDLRARGEANLDSPLVKMFMIELNRRNESPPMVVKNGKVIELKEGMRPLGAVPATAIKSGGTTKERPKDAKDEDLYYDTTLNIPIRFNGTNWLDQNDNIV